MLIPVPIPIGTKHIAHAHGAIWRCIQCTNCEQGYAFQLELQATGEDFDLLFLNSEGSAERAQAKAEENLDQKSRNVVLPVPCPQCGFYQEEMSQQLKDDATINSRQVAGLVLTASSVLPLMFGTRQFWILTAMLATVGLTMITVGIVQSFRFDPNDGDPEPRKALGQRYAVWGEDLVNLRAALNTTGPQIGKADV